MEIFTNITMYHWLTFGLLLLVAEVLGTAGFLIGAAIAALAMGLVLWVWPDIGAGTQLLLYVVSAMSATFVYFRLFRDELENRGRPLLNRRASRLIGHQFELDKEVKLGTAKVQIGDTLWTVSADTDLPVGTLVEVIDTDRMTLVISPR